MMKYESPIWAEVKANRNIYVTEDLARAAEIKALDAAYEQARREKMMINLTREEAQQVLDALENFCEYGAILKPIEVRDLLRARLAQPEPEPVAWRKLWEGETEYTYYWSCRYKGSEPLYRVPPQREFVGLTVDEIREELSYKNTMYDFARAIEAKLKEKNT